MDELSFEEKQNYSDEIGISVNTLTRKISGIFDIPILQVAYRFELYDKNIYIDYKFNKDIDEQNKALESSINRLHGIDEKIFDFLIGSDDESLKYIMYEYLREDNQNIIVNYETSSKKTIDNNIQNAIIDGFSIIQYGAKFEGKFDDKAIYSPSHTKDNTYKLLFIVEKIEIDCILSVNKEAYMTATFNFDNIAVLSPSILKEVELLVHCLSTNGKAILNKPLSEEIEKHRTKEQVNERFNEKVRSHRHSIFNLRKGYNNAMENLKSAILRCAKSNCIEQEDINSKINELKTVYEIYNLAVVYGISEESEIQKIKETLPKTISELLNTICNYCRIVYEKYEQKYTNNAFNEKGSSIEAFTVLFNLIVNAAETNAYESKSDEHTYYKIETYIDTEFYYISIMNPAIMNEKCLHFMNDENINLAKYSYDEIIKKWGGLTIVKKLNQKLGWNITFSIENDWTKVLIKINY